MFFKNQLVDIDKNELRIKVVSKQSKSTPGIYTRLRIKAGEKVLITFSGYKVTNGSVVLWIFGDKQTVQFDSNYSLKNETTELNYYLINDSSKIVNYKVGLLFRGGVYDDYFIIYNHRIQKLDSNVPILNITTKIQSKYVYIYHYDTSGSFKNSIWQKWIAYWSKFYIDTVDIVNLDKSTIYKYDVAIVDFFTIARFNKPKDFSPYIDLIKLIPKKALFLQDMHEYTFLYNDKTTAKYQSGNNTPFDKPSEGIAHLVDFLKNIKIEYLIARCACKEFDNILKATSGYLKKHFYLTHHINTDVFKDYNLKKVYDVILFGSMAKATYPFRFRLKKILTKTTDLKVKLVPNSKRIYNEELATEINKAWIGIATKSNFDYLANKYFEISGSATLVAGDASEQCKEIWSDDFLQLDSGMSDNQILTKIKKALSNKELLKDKIEKMYDHLHNNFSYKHFGIKLFYICSIIDGKVKSTNTKFYNLDDLNNQDFNAYKFYRNPFLK